MDLVIAMDDCAEGYHAPAFPGAPPFIRWTFEDPLAQGMTQVEQARSLKKVFLQILQRVTLFIELPWYVAAQESARGTKPYSPKN
ncbi:protein of unknown function [Burkholderia multivorans]